MPDTRTSSDAAEKASAATPAAANTACLHTPLRVPLMHWWQTPTHVMVRATVPDVPTAAKAQVHLTDKVLRIDTTCASTGHRYEVCAQWYGAVDAKASCRTKKPSGSREITVVACKSKRSNADDAGGAYGGGAVQVSWPHPFADRMYRSAVSVDWDHWQEEVSDAEYSTDDDGDEPLGALTPATLAEFCKSDAVPCEDSDRGGTSRTEGVACGRLPNESDQDFQRMIASLEDIGTRPSDTASSASTDGAHSTLEQIIQHPQMDKSELMSLLDSLRSKDMTGTDGVSGVELQQLQEQLEEVALEPVE